MYKGIVIGLFGLIFLSISTSTQAQKGWEAGGMAGLSFYFGDLNTGFDLTKPGPAISAIGRYNFNTRISVSFVGSYTYIYAKDENSDNAFEKARNLSFGSHIGALSSRFEFNFLPYTHGSYEEPFTPYVFAGLGIFRFNPRAKLNGEWYDLRPLTTEGQDGEYFGVSGALVLGGGFKFDISRVWSINIEACNFNVFTDYLDDVSGTYPNITQLRSRKGDLAADLSDRSIENDIFPNIGEEGRQRGNSKDNDSFNLLQISLMYYFGRVRCPRISNYD